MQTTGAVTAVRNGGKEAIAVLIDATLTGVGKAHDADAVTNGEKCALYIRNLKADNFRAAVKNDGGISKVRKGCPSRNGLRIRRWRSFRQSLTGSSLPIQDAPEVPWDRPDDWATVTRYAPKKGEYNPPKGRPLRTDDWTEAIQMAIDSGKTTVYFPKEAMQFTGTVHVRGKVRRLIGCELPWGRRSKGTWIIEDGDGPVIFERFDWTTTPTIIQHTAKRPLIARNVMGGDWQIDKGAGDTFFSDVSASSLRIGEGANVWARQLFMDNKTETKIVNNGGTLWIMGLKTDNDTTAIESLAGARTEVDGALVQPGPAKVKPPCFVIRDSSFSATVGEIASHRAPFAEFLTEIRGVGNEDPQERRYPAADRQLHADDAVFKLNGKVTRPFSPCHACRI